MQTECTAATTGFVEASNARMVESRLGSWKVLGLPNSLMSAPPENALPAPVSTIAFTVLSPKALARPSVNPTRVA
ncbi:hypothetical protein D9M72_173640 [compost metagenome]